MAGEGVMVLNWKSVEIRQKWVVGRWSRLTGGAVGAPAPGRSRPGGMGWSCRTQREMSLPRTRLGLGVSPSPDIPGGAAAVPVVTRGHCQPEQPGAAGRSGAAAEPWPSRQREAARDPPQGAAAPGGLPVSSTASPRGQGRGHGRGTQPPPAAPGPGRQPRCAALQPVAAPVEPLGWPGTKRGVPGVLGAVPAAAPLAAPAVAVPRGQRPCGQEPALAPPAPPAGTQLSPGTPS